MPRKNTKDIFTVLTVNKRIKEIDHYWDHKMNKACIIGESQLYARAPNRRIRKVSVRITACQQSGRDYRCQVQLKGIERSRHIYGIDSLQALVVAVQFLHNRVRALVNDGWSFYLEKNDEEPIDLQFIWFSKIPKKFVKR